MSEERSLYCGHRGGAGPELARRAETAERGPALAEPSCFLWLTHAVGTAGPALVAVRVAFTGLDLCPGRGNHPPETAGEVLALAGGLTGSRVRCVGVDGPPVDGQLCRAVRALDRRQFCGHVRRVVDRADALAAGQYCRQLPVQLDLPGSPRRTRTASCRSSPPVPSRSRSSRCGRFGRRLPGRSGSSPASCWNCSRFRSRSRHRMRREGGRLRAIPLPPRVGVPLSRYASTCRSPCCVAMDCVVCAHATTLLLVHPRQVRARDRAPQTTLADDRWRSHRWRADRARPQVARRHLEVVEPRPFAGSGDWLQWLRALLTVRS